MSGKTRIVLIVVGVVLLLLAVLPHVIHVNQFRPVIEEKVSAALGRRVQLGDLSFSLIGGSLSAENLSIGDDTKFSPSPFLTAKSLSVGVEILPLVFLKSLRVTGVTIVEPQVLLLRNPAGQWNYSSLGAPAESSAKNPASPSATGVSVRKLNLKDGTIIVGTTNSEKRSTYEHVEITTSDVSTSAKFPIALNADLPGGGSFKLAGTAGPLDATDAALTPIDAKLNVSAMNLAASGVLDPSVGLGGQLDLEAAINSQGGEAQTTGTATLSKALLIAGGAPASEPVRLDFDTKYDLRKHSGVLIPSTLKIGSAAARLSGTYVSSGESTVVNIKVDGENMPAKDLMAFLPALGMSMPRGASLQSGTLNTRLSLSGPSNRLVTTGNVGLLGAKLVGFDLASKMSGMGSLAGLPSGKDLEIEKLTANLRMAPDGLEADDVRVVLPSLGTVFGKGSMDAKNNLDFKMAATLRSGIGELASPVSGAANGITGAVGKGGNSACKNGTTVPFLIKGTPADPQFIPDPAGLAVGMVKSQAGCAGGLVLGAAKEGVQAPGKVASGIGGLFGKKKP
ncbi:MAG: AsmA family protein [Candidatus Acidiferrum sp.]